MTFVRKALLISLLLFTSTYAQEMIVGITTSQTEPRIVIFNATNPGSLFVGPQISQITSGQTIRSADYRPATGMLYIIATTAPSSGSQTAQLYTLSTVNGNASPVGSPFVLASSSTQVKIDFNPMVDRIRLVTGDRVNLRLNPNDGTVAGVDGTLAFAANDSNAGDVPSVANIAYSNNVPGGSPTTLYAIETGNSILATIGSINGSPVSPNNGSIFTVAPLSTSLTAPIGFDISGATSIAYVSNSNGVIYTLNLANGALTSLGSTGQNFIDITVLVAQRTLATTGLASMTSGARMTTGVAAATTGMASMTTGRVAATSGTGACTSNGAQRCLTNSTYTTCTNGFFSASQSCRADLVCVQSGNNVYCVRPSEATSTSSGTSTSTSGTSTSGTATSGSSQQVVPGQACSVNGRQSCVSDQTYTTCTNGFGSAVQNCNTGLRCNPSGQNIYCI